MDVVNVFGVVLLTAFLLYFIRKYFIGAEFSSSKRLDGKTVLITGGNSGIGKETAIDLAARGARVIIACRDKTRGTRALEDIKLQSNSQQVYLEQLDLASFDSVRSFAERFKKSEAKLHILINNAGMISGSHLSLTEDGFEMSFAVNHLGHFLLTNLLLDLLKKSSPARIVNVSSKGHMMVKEYDAQYTRESINTRQTYTAFKAYCLSKLANIHFTRELAKRLKGTGITSYALHPGVVDTEIFKSLSGILKIMFYIVRPLLIKTSKQGAQTTIYCAVAEELEEVSGKYYVDCAESTPSDNAKDDDAARKLWDASIDFVGL